MALNVIQKFAKICSGFTNTVKQPHTAAIVLAAGKGMRMESEEISKQMMEIDDIPIVVRSLLAFEKSKHIHEIIVVGTKEELPIYKTFKKVYNISKLKVAVEGGSCRAISASHGFEQVSKQCDFVAIHDAARCLITSDDIDHVIKEAYKYGAAIAAKKSTDTVKVADKDGFVEETPDRSLLWLAQTPQVFKKTLYKVALAKAEALDETVTDDAMLAENAGFKVKIAECKDENIKITVLNDIHIAKKILEQRAQKQEV